MKMLTAMCVLGICILPKVGNCLIMTANSMTEVHQAFKQAEGRILGVFDIDMVLKQSSNPAFQMPNMKKHKIVLKRLLAPLNSLEKNLTLNLITIEEPSILIEDKTPQLITDIQKTTPTIALTSTLTGALGKIPDITFQRYTLLKNLKIDFSNSFPEIKESLTFNTIEAYRGNFPEFKNGILSTNGEQDKVNKGEILVEFLKKVRYVPETIIFIDDREDNIKNVESALALGYPKIRYLGIIYKGAENYPSREVNERFFEKAWIEKIDRAKKMATKIP